MRKPPIKGGFLFQLIIVVVMITIAVIMIMVVTPMVSFSIFN